MQRPLNEIHIKLSGVIGILWRIFTIQNRIPIGFE